MLQENTLSQPNLSNVQNEHNTTTIAEAPDLAELKDSRGPTSAEVITTPELVDNLRHPEAARRGTDKGPRSYTPATDQLSSLPAPRRSSRIARTNSAVQQRCSTPVQKRGENNTTAVAEVPDLAELKDSRGPTSAEVITTPELVDNLRHPEAARRGTDKGPRSYTPATDQLSSLPAPRRSSRIARTNSAVQQRCSTPVQKRGENNTTAVAEVPDLAELKDSRGPTSAEVITTPELVDNLRHPEAARRGTDKGPRSYTPATEQISNLSTSTARTYTARGEDNTTAIAEAPDLAELKDSRGPTSAEVITTPELVDNLRHPEAARRGTDKGPRSYTPATDQLSSLPAPRRSSRIARTNSAVQQRCSTPVQKRGENNTTAVAEVPDLAELKDSRGPTSAEVITTPELVDNLRHPEAARRGTDKGPRSYTPATDQLSSLPAPRRSSRIARTNSAVQQRCSTPVQKRGENNTTAVAEVPDLAELKDSRGPTSAEVITTPELVDNLRHPEAARRGTDKGPRSYTPATDQLSSLPAPRRSSRIARTNSAVQQRCSTPVQKRGENNTTAVAEVPDLAELKDSRGPTSAEVITTPELVDTSGIPKRPEEGRTKDLAPIPLPPNRYRTCRPAQRDLRRAMKTTPLRSLKLPTWRLKDSGAHQGTDKGPRSYTPATEQISNLSTSTARTYTARDEDNTTTIAEAPDLAELKDSRGPTSAEVITTPELVDNLRHPEAARRGTDKGPRSYTPATEQISNLSTSTARTYTARDEDNTTTIAEAPDLAELKDSRGPTSAEREPTRRYNNDAQHLSKNAAKTTPLRAAEVPDLAELKDGRGPTSAEVITTPELVDNLRHPEAARRGTDKGPRSYTPATDQLSSLPAPRRSSRIARTNSAVQQRCSTPVQKRGENNTTAVAEVPDLAELKDSRGPTSAEVITTPELVDNLGIPKRPERDGQRTSLLCPCHRSVIEPASST
ncbi:hypothetical protein pipiens_018879 [Culex pipiens pipiens]|uniref:Uncharacterized protein n=1 Tax=Culex pipiens pipiens TaxID=38569 RepID=A0ABD1DXI0_CULPP